MAPHSHTITQYFTICGHSHSYTAQCNSSKNPFKRIFTTTCPTKEITNVYSICHDCRHAFASGRLEGMSLEEGIAAILKYREETGHRGSVFPSRNERNEVIIVPELSDAGSTNRDGYITIGFQTEMPVAMDTGKGKERRGSESSQKTIWPDFRKQKPEPQEEQPRMRSQQKTTRETPRNRSPGSIDTFGFEIQEPNHPSSSSNQPQRPLEDNDSRDRQLGKRAPETQPPFPCRSDSLNWRLKPLPRPEIGRSITQANRTMPPPPLFFPQLANHSRSIGRGRFPIVTRSEAERTAEVRATASIPIGAPDVNKPLPLPSRMEGRPGTPKPGGNFEDVNIGLGVPSKAYIPRFM